jgi:hypothetical protein
MPHHGADRMTEPKYPRRNLYLEAGVMDSLRDIGNKNASRGVRVAVAFYEQHHFTKLETQSANMPIDKWCVAGQEYGPEKPWTLEPKSVDKWYRPKKKAKADVPFTFDGEK